MGSAHLYSQTTETTQTTQPTDPSLAPLQEDVKQLMRGQIDLQKTLIDSGITPALKDDLKKLKQFDKLEKRINALQKKNEDLSKYVDELKTPSEVATQAQSGYFGASWVWVLMAGFLVMLMQAGFALVESGFTRAKNAAHTMTMNLLDYGIGMLAFWAIGFAFMFGGVGEIGSIALDDSLDNSLAFSIGGEVYSFMGIDGFFLSGDELYTGGVFTLFLFQMVFAATANTICTGALAERWKLKAFCAAAILVTGVIYPIFGHWVWGGGWLASLGYIDFAGSTVVHMVGGVIALVGTMVVGPRVGKFNEDGSPNPIPGHNYPMACLGTFLLAFGWFGFNAGSSLDGTAESIGIIATNTALASGAGMVIAAMVTKMKFGFVDPTFCCNGMLAGLVGITAPCAFVDAWAAVLIGAVSGVLVVFSAIFIEETLKLDDPVGAISVHGTCGAWGGLSVGLFANGKNGVSGLLYGDMTQLLIQSVGVTVCLIFVGLLGYFMFLLIDMLLGNRASDEEQEEGLDLAEMGVEAYSSDVSDDT